MLWSTFAYCLRWMLDLGVVTGFTLMDPSTLPAQYSAFASLSQAWRGCRSISLTPKSLQISPSASRFNRSCNLHHRHRSHPASVSRLILWAGLLLTARRGTWVTPERSRWRCSMNCWNRYASASSISASLSPSLYNRHQLVLIELLDSMLESFVVFTAIMRILKKMLGICCVQHLHNTCVLLTSGPGQCVFAQPTLCTRCWFVCMCILVRRAWNESSECSIHVTLTLFLHLSFKSPRILKLWLWTSMHLLPVK